MRPHKASLEFRRFLQQRELVLKRLSVAEGVQAACLFYESMRVTNPAPDGDAFAYICSLPFRHPRVRFELSLIRLLKVEGDHLKPSRLRLSFCYDWMEVLRWMGPDCEGLPDTSGRASSPLKLPALRTALERDPAYLAVLDKRPMRVELRYEKIFRVRG